MQDGSPSMNEFFQTTQHSTAIHRYVMSCVALFLLGWTCLAPVTAQDSDPVDPPELENVDPVEMSDSESSPSEEGLNEEGRGDSFVVPPREVLRLLEQAELLADEERFVDAVRCVAAIFESQADYFLPDRNTIENSALLDRTVKSEALLLLSEMPPEALRYYELQYGIPARRALDEAARRGDMNAIAGVVARSFPTEAGHEASLMLGLHEVGLGRYPAAVRCFRRLYEQGASRRFEPTLSLAFALALSRSGDPSEAIAVLIALRETESGRPLSFRGEVRPFFMDPEGAIDWLDELFGEETSLPPQLAADIDWTMHRAAPSRNASIEAGDPLLMPTWRVPTVEYPVVQSMIDEQRHRKIAIAESMVPSLFPIVVDGIVLLRTLHELLAVDLETGKRLWTIEATDPFEAYAGPVDGPDAAVQLQRMRSQRLDMGLRCRMWGDTLYGTISSDGSRVYSVEGLRFPTGSDDYQLVLVVLPGGQQRMERILIPARNELMAHDVGTGDLVWRIGGGDEMPDSSPLLAGYFFLGVPLPYEGALYVMAEKGARIYLLVINPSDGSLRWELPLSNVDREISGSPLRQIVGLTPSASGGILVCPTGHGTLAAVDPASQSLIWGFAYDLGSSTRGSLNGMIQQFRVNPDPSGRWSDASVILGENCVIATPPDSPDLYCLDLGSGRLLWKTPRSRWDALYVACVYEGKVFLVSESELVALRLEDGLPLWRDRPSRWAPGAHPSGQGFLSGDEYYAPLSDGTILRIGLRRGDVVQAVRSRSDVIPGNLVQGQGCIISQRGDAIEAFYQRDRLERMTAEQLEIALKDPETLSLRGRIAWNDARFSDAIPDFREAYALSESETSRLVLLDVLFDALHHDFAEGVHFLDVTESLINSSDDRILLHRLLVEGYTQRGDGDAAMDSLLALFGEFEELGLSDLATDSFRMELGREVRRDRWIAGCAEGVYDAASDESRLRLESFIQRRFEDVIAGSSETNGAEINGAESLTQLETLYAWSADLPLGPVIRDELASRYVESGETVKLGLLLESSEGADSETEGAGRWATMARYHESRGEWSDAAKCYQFLVERYGTVSRRWSESSPDSEPPTTGRDFGTGRLAAEEFRDARSVKDWPTGRVEVEWGDARSPRPPAVGNSLEIAFIRTPSPYFSDIRFFAPYRPNLPLNAVDVYGQALWSTSLNESAIEFSHPSRMPVQLAALGRLLLVYVNSRIAALDTSQNPPALLWSRDAVSNMSPMGSSSFSVPWNPPPVHPRPTTKEFPSIVVLPDVVCFSHFGKLVAVDPYSGKELWSHEGPRTITGLFGGEGRIFLVERTTLEDRIVGPDLTIRASVFRASDGAPLGERRVPRDNQAVRGAHVLTRVFPHVPDESPSPLSPSVAPTLPDAWELPDASDLPTIGNPASSDLSELDGVSNAYALRLVDPWRETPVERIVWEQPGMDKASLLEVFDRKIVVSANSDGEIRLFRLSDGTLMSRFQIDLSRVTDVSTPPHGLHFWKTQDGYMLLLLANAKANEFNFDGDRVQIQPLVGDACQRVSVGFLMALDRAGTPQWSESTVIRNAYWIKDVPSGFPLVLFGGHAVEISRENGATNSIWFLGIDRRTGRVILDTHEEESPYNIQWQCDPYAKTIDLFTRSQRLTLTFTDEEVVPVEHSQFFTDAAGNRPFAPE